MYRLFIALRYLLHKRINILAVVGVAISVTVLFVVHSVMTGFGQQVRSHVRGNLSDLIVEEFGQETFAGYEEEMARLEKLKHVQAVSPRLEGLALVRLGNRSGYRYGQFIGIDLERECRTTQLAAYWLKAEEQEKKDDPNHVMVKEPGWGTPGKKGLPPAIVGYELPVLMRYPDGKSRSLGVGETIVLVTASSTGLESEVQPFAIAGKFKSGESEYDSQVALIRLQDAQDYLRKRGKVTSIAVKLDDYRNAREVQAEILGIATLDELLQMRKWLQEAVRQAGSPVALPLENELNDLRRNYVEWRATANPLYIKYSGEVEWAYFDMEDQLKAAGVLDKYSKFQELHALRNALADRMQNSLGKSLGPGYHFYLVQTWEDKRRTLMTAVDIERAITVIVQSFVFLLAWALIYSILSSAVVEKTKDIGILRSLGATRHGVMSIFLLNGLIIGFIGSTLGIVGGTLFCDYINQIADVVYELTGLRVFPPDIYLFDKIPVDSNPTNWAITITVAALVVSLAGAYFPARKAARMNPVDALRYE